MMFSTTYTYTWLLLLFDLLVYPPLVSAGIQYADFNKCCEKARGQFYDNINTTHDNVTYTCGASFSDGKQPSPPIYVSLTWCRTECGGFQPSRLSKNHLNEILSPLVGFLIPALVFSVSIPRGWQLKIPERLFKEDWFTAQGSMNLVLALVIVTVETLRWISVVFVCAGPILVGGLYEMFLDHKLLQGLAELQKSGSNSEAEKELRRRKILVTLLLGNLNIEQGNPKEGAEEFIVNASDVQARSRLHSLLQSQGSFGVIVGSPVIFYVGSFIYAIIDALKNLGDNDTSHAIALGIWYSIFVIVAMVCGCLLGCNNLAALEGIISKNPPPRTRGDSASEVFLSRYQPVSIWDRGVSTYKWAKAHDLEGYLGTNTSIYLTGVSAAILMTVPCWLAFVVSFNTPEIGLGCRSFMFFLYWLSQVELIGIFVIGQTMGRKTSWPNWANKLAETFRDFAFMLAFFSGVGGTFMQLTGVFRNCICKAGVRAFINPNGNYILQLATDTEIDRKMALNVWMSTGACSLVVLVSLCLYAWWYQTNIRQQCSEFIHQLEHLPLVGDKLLFFKLRASMEDPPRPYREFIQIPAQREFLQLGPEHSCGELRICQVLKRNTARHLAAAASNGSTFYLHVFERSSIVLNGALELTWQTTPDDSPGGDFMWQGNRLAWRTHDGRYLDGFFINSSVGEVKKIYLNAMGYGVDPIAPVPIEDVIHFTLHRVNHGR